MGHLRFACSRHLLAMPWHPLIRLRICSRISACSSASFDTFPSRFLPRASSIVSSRFVTSISPSTLSPTSHLDVFPSPSSSKHVVAIAVVPTRVTKCAAREARSQHAHLPPLWQDPDPRRGSPDTKVPFVRVYTSESLRRIRTNEEGKRTPCSRVDRPRTHERRRTVVYERTLSVANRCRNAVASETIERLHWWKRGLLLLYDKTRTNMSSTHHNSIANEETYHTPSSKHRACNTE